MATAIWETGLSSSWPPIKTVIENERERAEAFPLETPHERPPSCAPSRSCGFLGQRHARWVHVADAGYPRRLGGGRVLGSGNNGNNRPVMNVRLDDKCPEIRSLTVLYM